jgi:uncharacterized protein (TIGR02453 family)
MATKKTTKKNARSAQDGGAPAGFTGFADADGKFFKKLAKNQDRDWFNAHKAEYEEGWAKPMSALLDAVRPRIDGAYEDVELAEPKLFRLHRDVRFSADKSPYKTHVSGLIAARPGRAVMEAPAALYLQIGHDERFAAAGFYIMPKEALAGFRAALLDDARGKEIAKIVKALEKKGFVMEAGEETKRVPAGVDPDHPRADLLRKKGLIARYPDIDPALLVSPDLADWLVQRSRDVAPLIRWLVFETGRDGGASAGGP